MNTYENKVKIVYLVTKGDMGGAQKYVNQLALGFNKDIFECLVVSGNLGGSLRVDKKLKWLTNDYRPWLFFYNDFLAIIELWWFFKKERPNVVHLNSSKAGVIGAVAAKLAGVKKVVFTAHGWVFSDTKLAYLKRLFFIYLHRVAGIFQNVIINVSEYDRKLALKNNIAKNKKLLTIWNGIDVDDFLNKFLAKDEAKKNILKKINKDFLENKPWIGSIGRLVKEKNYALLIESAVKVDAYFFIIGEGLEYDLLSKLIKENKLENKFFIVKPEGEDAKFLRALDVFVLTSRKEGLPYTLIEAMAASVPVVVSEVGGMPEIVENNRGYIFKNGDLESLVHNIERATERDNDLVIRAFDFCRSNLDIKNVVKKVEEIYLS